MYFKNTVTDPPFFSDLQVFYSRRHSHLVAKHQKCFFCWRGRPQYHKHIDKTYSASYLPHVPDWDYFHSLFQEFESRRREQCPALHWIPGLEKFSKNWFCFESLSYKFSKHNFMNRASKVTVMLYSQVEDIRAKNKFVFSIASLLPPLAVCSFKYNWWKLLKLMFCLHMVWESCNGKVHIPYALNR